MSLQSQIESLLFISIKPISFKQLKEQTKAKKKDDVARAVSALIEKYNIDESGVSIQKIGEKVQMVTSSSNASLVSEFIKDETSGELTPASLETLTVIAYRGPISKTELELIRGVNCSVILRNLLIRGLIEESKDKNEFINSYEVTFDFLKYLGLNEIEDLPDYEVLNGDENLKTFLHPEAVQEEGKERVIDSSSLNFSDDEESV